MSTNLEHCNDEPDAMLDDAEIAQVADEAVAKLLAAAKLAQATKISSDRAHADQLTGQRDRELVRVSLERAESENPTRADHGSPCPTVLSHIQTMLGLGVKVGVLIGLVGTAATFFGGAGIWLMTRIDSGDKEALARDEVQTKAGNERNVAISNLQTEVRVELSAIKASQQRTEDMLAKLYRISPPNP